MKHLLSIEQLSAKEIQHLLDSATHLKRQRGREGQPLAGQAWALIFTKSSTRTRVSFEVGIRELGGFPMFLSGNDIRGHRRRVFQHDDLLDVGRKTSRF